MRDLKIIDTEVHVDQENCNEYIMMVAGIKQILKNRKITYKALSQLLGSSEHAIKYMLTKKDGSISDLVCIGDALGISFYDLVEYTKNTQGKFSTFNKRQEDFFLSYPMALRFFLDLYMVGIDQTAKFYNLGETEAHDIVRSLETLGLVERHSDTEVKLLLRPPYVYSQKLSDFLAKLQLNNMIDCFNNREICKYDWFLDTYANAFATLTPKQVRELNIEIKDILKRYVHRGYIQRTTGTIGKSEELTHYGFFFGVSKRSIDL